MKHKSKNTVTTRHVLPAEADADYNCTMHFANMADNLRKAGNELIAVMSNRYNQLIRTKSYRKLQNLYGKASEKYKQTESDADKAEKDRIAGLMHEMQEEYHVIRKERKGYADNLQEIRMQVGVCIDEG